MFWTLLASGLTFVIAACTAIPLLANAVAGLLRGEAYVPDFRPNAPRPWRKTTERGVRSWAAGSMIFALAMLAMAGVGFKSLYLGQLGAYVTLLDFPPPQDPKALTFTRLSDGVQVAFSQSMAKDALKDYYRKVLQDEGWNIELETPLSLSALKDNHRALMTFTGPYVDDRGAFPCRLILVFSESKPADLNGSDRKTGF